MVRDIRERKIAEGSRAGLSPRLIEAHEEERGRVAEELRDDLNQRMAVLQIGIAQFEQDFPGLSLEARMQLHSLMEVAIDIASSIHDLSHRLRPSLLHRFGPVASIERLCREPSDRHNLQIQFVHHGIPEKMPKDVTLCLYRIAQEALRNVVLHSGAAGAQVELSGFDDRIELCISDSGVGFSPESAKRTSGLGLISMQERLRLVGGQLGVESDSSRGTRIRVRILREAFEPSVDVEA
jgi:signal transduction histidine kinase